MVFFDLNNDSKFFYSFNANELNIHELNRVPFKTYLAFNRMLIASVAKSISVCQEQSNQKYDFKSFSFIDAFFSEQWFFLVEIEDLKTITEIKKLIVEECWVRLFQKGSLAQRQDFIHNNKFIKVLTENIVNATMESSDSLDFKSYYYRFVCYVVSTIEYILKSIISDRINEQFDFYLKTIK